MAVPDLSAEAKAAKLYRKKITKIKRFLKHFERTGRKIESLRRAKLSWNSFNKLMDHSPFREAIQLSSAVRIEVMEAEADRRGIKGTLEPVFQGGELVGHKRRFSDTLLVTRLKAEAPEKYGRDGGGGGDTNIQEVHIYMPDNGRSVIDADFTPVEDMSTKEG